MEVVMQAPPNIDFNFDSACSSPYISAPSSPKRFGEFYFSAPTSPTRVAAIYREINDGLSVIRTNGTCSRDGPSSSSTVVPFNWDEKPAEPKSNDSNEDDFAFDFSGQLERTSLTADELFDGGVIRPLKPPSRLQVPDGVDEFPTRKSAASSPRTSKSPISQGKKMFREAFSPRHKKDFDSFAAASQQEQKEPEHDRGRERVPASKSGRRETRSLSPFRVSEFTWEEEQQQSTKAASSNSKSSSYSSSWFCKGSKKWRLKDFLLFRSASEGRVTDKDPLGKFAVPSTSKKQEYVKNSSIRSTDSSGSVSGSRRRGPVSAHELHYTVNRAVSEEMKKKTFLPYKQGLLGFLRFNSTVHGLSRSFGSLTR